MRYYVSLNERPAQKAIVVEVTQHPDGSISAAIDGKPVEVDATAAGSQWSVRVDDAMIDVAFDGRDGHPVAEGPTGGRTTGRVEKEPS